MTSYTKTLAKDCSLVYMYYRVMQAFYGSSIGGSFLLSLRSELGDKFEIIFCSGDRDESSMKEYYKEQREAGGDWAAIKLGCCQGI